ncbi:unnamed protein product [Owenia fusiformis]|uniref:Vacuolar protein sorting-associated protein 16 homolog n=1 Tax=Owenia fusiformis TaxID=6347 RepID=A0A8S4N2I7_OWEFU|nr:unnamed protein product [Owenia fusiformis]
MALISADWNPLGEVFYRKHELYTMEWSDLVDLNKFVVAAAPYGGPIALIRDENKFVRVQGATKPIIYIYSASGIELSAIRWNSGHVIAMGWSVTEDLLCIQDDGVVLVYDIFGTFKRTFSMGQEAKDTKVIECKIFNSFNGTGIAVVTSTYRIFIINNVDDPRIRRLAEVPGLNKPPSSWAIINHERQSRALVAKDAELYLVDHGGQYTEQHPDVKTTVNSFVEMSVSVNNKYLALFSDTGLLWIGSSDLSRMYCEFDTKSPSRPLQLSWCGTGAVVGQWENIVLMVGPGKDWVKYSFDGPVHMVPEIDGLRIISKTTHEFLQKVPAVTEDIFKIGSMSPGAMLFEASREFQRGSQRADEYIRMIPDIGRAVEECIEAAGEEHEPSKQQLLLRAASFGKCFLTDIQPESFVNMCQMLRVLNNIHDYKLAIPLTKTQLEQLTVPVLIDRLVLRRQYCLAIRICQYLNIPEADGASRILAHWACYKVQQTHVDDELVATAIANKLGDTPGVSYSEIANKAIECGRTELAIRLLDFEPKAAEQVPLLMKMKRDTNALYKSIESGDTDLMYTVILHLKEIMPLGDFLMTIRTHPIAHALYLQFCREENKEMLRELYYQEDNFQQEANCRVVESYGEERLEVKLTSLVAAQDAYTKSKNEWAARQTEEQVKLLKYQRRLEEELNRQYMDLSLHQTMYKLTMEANHKLAESLRKEFKVPDRRFWWLRVNALCESNDWTELEKFSKSKKSPIGYEPFVDGCIKYGNRHEATKYLPKVSQENKVNCYIKVGQLDQAAEFAFLQKSIDDLNIVQQKCGPMNRATVEKIQTMKAQLQTKR